MSDPVHHHALQNLISQLLHDPEFRNPFLSIDKVKDIVLTQVTAKSPRYSLSQYAKAEQKVYEIARYVLGRAPEDIRMDTESHFWHDLDEYVTARFGGWVTNAEACEIIDEVINEGIVKRFLTMLRPLCASILYKRFHVNDSDLLEEIVQIGYTMCIENNAAFLRGINDRGAVRKYIKTSLERLFLKWETVRITEPFPHPNGKECGYAHLTLGISSSRLTSLYGENWYERTTRIAFRDAIERFYHPYDAKTSYANVAQKNLSIQKELDELFLSLKTEQGMGETFPAKTESLSYNKTEENYMVFDVNEGEGLKIIKASFHKPELETEDGPQGEDDLPKPNVNDVEEEASFEPVSSTESRIEFQEKKEVIDRIFHSLLSMERELLKLWLIDDVPSKEIGFDFYQQGIIPDSVLVDKKGTHHSPDSSDGQKMLAQHVDGTMKRRIYKKIKDILQRHDEWLNEEDYKVLLQLINGI